MLKFIKRLLIFFSLFLLFFVVKEFLSLYTYLSNLNVYAGYTFLALLAIGIIYFVVVPLIELLRIPVNPSPTTELKNEPKIIAKRVKALRNNPHILQAGEILDNTDVSYKKALKILSPESRKIQKKYVTQVFYRTGIVQNGFLDAMIILSSNTAMIKEIFKLYNGRVSNRDVVAIYKQVYYSLVIGGSETIEYATEEMFSKMATEGIKNVPFLDKIMSSMADGYLNAVLTTRVALITENYCTKTYVESYQDIYPSPIYLVDTAKNLTGSIIENIFQSMRNMVSEKTVDVMLKAGNPVGFIFEKGIEATFPDKDGENSKLKENLKTGFRFIGNPIIFGIERLVHRSRKKQKLLSED